MISRLELPEPARITVAFIKDVEDREARLAEAKQAVSRLRRLTKKYADLVSERDRLATDQEARRGQAEAQRRFGDEIDQLRKRFLELQAGNDPHGRGRALESLC